MAVLFAIAVVVPTPDLGELNFTDGEVASVGASENGNDTSLRLLKNGDQIDFLVHGLSDEETKRVRALMPGSKVEVRYWDPPFGLELDIWQLKHEDQVIVPYQNRLLEFQLTQRLIAGAGVIMGIIAFLPYLGPRKAEIARP